MTSPTTSLDQRYSASDALATSWADTKRELENAELFWLTTVRGDGRPHSTPLVAAWSREELHFTTGADEQKSKNLRANSHILLSTGRNDWQGGLDIVVEGDAHLSTEQSANEEIALAFGTKWAGDWQYVARDGKFFHPEGFEVLLYSVKPQKVLVFAKGTFGHTTHQFGEP